MSKWIKTKWRPSMGWAYLAICIFDFMIAPILWAMLLAYLHLPLVQWDPLTLRGAGLFHMAMGAILGVSAWGRSKEKIAGVSGDDEDPTSLK